MPSIIWRRQLAGCLRGDLREKSVDRRLQALGDVRKLAAIPAGKPSGAWAQAIGLANAAGSFVAARLACADAMPTLADLAAHVPAVYA